MDAKNSLKTLEHAFDLLDLLSTNRQELGISDLSRQLGISKPAAHRIATTLHERGLLQKNAETGRYALGLRLWEIGCRAVGRLGIREVAFPYLEELWHQTRETVYLATYDRGSVVWVDKIDSPKSVRVHTRLGGRAPAHAVACGKVMLAYLNSSEVADVLNHLKAYTEHTIIDSAAFAAELAAIRQRGYATADREWDPAVVGVAAPVRDGSHRLVASVGVSAPSSYVAMTWPGEVGPQVVETAARISRALGYLPGR